MAEWRGPWSSSQSILLLCVTLKSRLHCRQEIVGAMRVGALPRGRWQVVRVHPRVGVHWQASCAFRRHRQPRLALSWKVSVVELELRRGEGLLGVVAGQACRKAEA